MTRFKVCTKCGVVKPVTEFHSDSRKKDGKRPICKTCTNEYARKTQADRTRYMKEWRRKRRETS